MEPKEKLPKVTINNQLKKSTNGILDIYLKKVDTIPEICDKVYAMGRATGFKLGKFAEGHQGDRTKKSVNGENRWERKLKKAIKELYQIETKTNTELYRRKQQRKATKKEKEIIKGLRVMTEKDTTNYNLKNAREQWLDKLKYKKIKLA